MLRESRDTDPIFPSLSLQDYTVRGLLGKATDDFCEDGRLVEKSTYGESPQDPRAEGGAAVAAFAFAVPWFLRSPPLPTQTIQPPSVTPNTLSSVWLLEGFGHMILSSVNKCRVFPLCFPTWHKCHLPREAPLTPR